MNHYTFEELSVGMQESFEVDITEEMLHSFVAITGDINPLHNDREFARKMGHPDKVAFGMLTASFLSTLAGVYLPGELSLIQAVETKFLRPVIVGDTLTITGTIAELHESVEQIELKVVITNQNQIKVLRGKMKIGVLHER